MPGSGRIAKESIESALPGRRLITRHRGPQQTRCANMRRDIAFISLSFDSIELTDAA